MTTPARFLAAWALVFALWPASTSAQRQMENLGRGVVALHQPDGKVFVSWRLLGTDPDGVAFNVYRKAESLAARGGGEVGPSAPRAGAPVNPAGRAGGRGSGRGRGGELAASSGEPVRLNAAPLVAGTWLVDDNANLAARTSYFVRAVVDGQELPPSASFTLAAGAPPLPYLSIPLEPPAGGTTPDGVAYTYNANDGSAADVDGDREYELILKWDPTNSKDNAFAGFTGNVYLDAYKLDGRRLWRIDLGRNVRAGAHYTQFMAYDLDGDGRAELVCKTADGTVDGTGKVIGDPKAFWPEAAGLDIPATGGTGSTLNAQGRPVQSTRGRILRGPEYLTVFEGPTGRALATTDYVPARGKSEDWGDAYVNRADRYLAGVAYLDGVHPSVVMCRGYYTRAVLAAWDWRDGKLTQRWIFDSDDGTPGNEKYRGQGNHQLSVADVDNDGKDEIVYGAAVIDHDGKGLYSTGRGHGDAMHVSDLDPDRPGLEVWMVHEKPSDNAGGDFRDAKTGELLWKLPSTGDAGRGLAANIDPRYKGYQCWSSPSDGLYTCKGVKISERKPRVANFAVWWDGDLLRELLNSNRITKWDWQNGTETTLLTAQGCVSNNGTKSTPVLSADLLGDWREEVVLRTADNKELRIYTTTIPTPHRLVTLMHDPQYRVAIAWQNVAYNQPPHPSFYLGEGMAAPVRPKISVVGARL